MYQTGRWLYVVFMCQQAVKKLVKGLYTLYVDDDVPKTHNIINIINKLPNNLKLKVSENNLLLFEKLTVHYIDKRYPSFKAKLSNSLNENNIKLILEDSKEVFKWLLTLK